MGPHVGYGLGLKGLETEGGITENVTNRTFVRFCRAELSGHEPRVRIGYNY